MLLMDRITRRMSPKRTGMHFLFCFVDLALIAPNIRWIRRFSAAAQHLIMVHFNLSPLFLYSVRHADILFADSTGVLHIFYKQH